MRHKSAALSSTLFLICLAGHSARAQELSGEAPFSAESNRIIIQVKIMGKGPYNMLVRTGLPHSYLDISVARDARVEVLTLPFSPGGDKDVPAVTFARLKDIEVGSYRSKKLVAVVQDFSDFNAGGQHLSVPIHGILGFNLLDGRIVQIDYPRRVIRFLASSPYKKDGAGQADGRRLVLPFRVSTEHAFPVVNEVYVGAKKIKGLLDTGYEGALALTPRAVKLLGLPATGAPSPVVMKVGSAPESSLSPEVVPEGASQDKPLDVYGAVIGAGFLSHYVVTFDGKDKTVTLERP